MRIKKRRTPEIVIEEMVDPEWRKVFNHKFLRCFAQDPYGLTEQNIEASHLLDVASKCKRGTLIQTPLKEKVFMYALCFFLWRVYGKSLLTDQEYAALARHLWSGVICDKINQIGNVPLSHRMKFIFDIPHYGKLYRKAKSIPLSEIPDTMPDYKTDMQLLRRTQPKEAVKPKLRRVKPKK